MKIKTGFAVERENRRKMVWVVISEFLVSCLAKSRTKIRKSPHLDFFLLGFFKSSHVQSTHQNKGWEFLCSQNSH